MRKSLVIPAAIVSVFLFLWLFIWYIGSNNPGTPAGYVGYLTQGSWFGKAHFVGMQVGPTSPGKTWLLHAINTSITPYTYSEDFEGNNSVMSKDNLKIAFRMHITWNVRLDPNQVRNFIEHYSTLGTDADPEKIVVTAYNNYIKEPFRTYARDEIQKYNGLDIKDNITPIGDAVLARMQELTKKTPFEVTGVVVGNVQYPAQVSDAVSMKLAATQDLQRKETEIQIAEKDKDIRIVQAQGISKAMDIINQKLTPLYVQHEAIDAQKSMINSPNHTVIYIPVGPNGVPVVGNLDLSQGTGQQSSDKK